MDTSEQNQEASAAERPARQWLTISMTHELKRRLREQARASGLKVSEWARRELEKAAP